MLVKLIPTYTPHIIVQEGERIEEEQAGGRKGTQDRRLFTAGEGGRGRNVWEDSDRLHADLQRKSQKERLPGESEKENTEKQKMRETVRAKDERAASESRQHCQKEHVWSHFISGVFNDSYVWERHGALWGQI